MKKSTGALMVGLLIACVGRAETRGQSSPYEMVIHVYNEVDIPAPLLERALQRAAAVLATAGVKPAWLQAARGASEAHTVDLSRREGLRQSERQSFVLLLATQVPPDYAEGALGIAFPQSDTGVSAIIFWNRIQRRLQDSHEADGPTLLGLGIAHELGHVLLKSSAHGHVGIMKSPWARADLECAEARLSSFTRSERNAIRRQRYVIGSTLDLLLRSAVTGDLSGPAVQFPVSEK